MLVIQKVRREIWSTYEVDILSTKEVNTKENTRK